MNPLAILQHEAIGSPGSIGPALRALGVSFMVRRLDLGEPLPVWPEETSGIITLGGYMHVTQTQEFPFLSEEVGLLRNIAASGGPVWGICLGAQLLTIALGGRVFRRKAPEVGWTLVDKTADDPLLAGISSPFVAFNWHEYSCRAPAGGRTVARCGDGAQVLRLGAKAWATQFHPEMDREMSADWLRCVAREYPNSDGRAAARLSEDTDLYLPGYPELCRQLTHNFVHAGGLAVK